MATKTYIPTLVFILQRACRYIGKYRSVIIEFLPEGGAAALDAIVLACEVFLALAPDNTGD